MRAKGKASTRVADILNRMQAEEPVTSDVIFITKDTESHWIFEFLISLLIMFSTTDGNSRNKYSYPTR